MTPALIDTLGDELYDALKACRVVEPLSTRHPDITIDKRDFSNVRPFWQGPFFYSGLTDPPEARRSRSRRASPTWASSGQSATMTFAPAFSISRNTENRHRA